MINKDHEIELGSAQVARHTAAALARDTDFSCLQVGYEGNTLQVRLASQLAASWARRIGDIAEDLTRTVQSMFPGRTKAPKSSGRDSNDGVNAEVKS